PDNAVLMVAGKFDEKKTVWLVHEYFSKIPKPTRELIPTYTDEPTQDGERSVSLKRAGDVQAVSCMYHIPPGSHPDAAAVDILTDIMTNEPSGRLYKALVETKKASSQWGWCATLKEPGFVYFNAEVRKENSLEEAKSIMLKTLDDVAMNPPTKEEVERAKNKQIKDFELFFRNTEQVGRAISEYIGMGDWRLAFIYRDNIRKVTPEDVQRVALTYFKPDNRTVGMFVPESKPERAEIPNAPNITALVKDYKGDPLVAQGEDFDPSPSNIESRTHRGQANNTVKYALLPKTTKGNVVQANITLRFGSAESLKGKATISNFTASMLDKGTKTKSRQQIKDEFDKLKARVGFFGGGGSAGVSIQTTRENMPAVLALVMEVLKQPAFNEKEFEEMRNEELAGIEQQKSDPQALVGNAFNRHLNPYPKDDIRYVPTIDEELENVKSVKLEDCKKFYTDFYGADQATVSVVGDFDEAAVKGIIEKELGAWKSKAKYQRVEDQYADVPAVNQNIETPDKANAMFLAGMNLNLRDDDPDYPALVLGNYILGGGFLNSRLATRIRQKEGLSYGVGSQLNADAQDKSGSFLVYAIYAPENRDKLEAAYKDEIAKMLKDGFTEQEINDAKSGLLQSRKVSRSQDNSLSGTLNAMLHIGRTMKFTEELEQKLAAVTPEQILSAMRKHIDLNKISAFKGGDFANKMKKP
ncbi:MAG TPA: insulinase family protein, partial [Saprospiraceae bacterium]|nr:insulinase family protein [Saprospiraceae bacterium]